jgi:glycosyltransferase involved in cell wall biosynthesis
LTTISVVIPTFNSAGLVTDAIDSALAQSRPPTEVIVVDDGSTDDTAKRLACYGPRIRYIHQPNGGVSAARNRGVAEAAAEYVAFLDADDVWHPRKLERQVAALAAQPGCVLLGTHTYDWPGTHPEATSGEVQPVFWERLAVRNELVTSSLLARRDTLSAVGPFDTRLQGPEDHDLWIRLAEVGPVGILAAPLTGYRDVPDSLSKHARRMEEGMWRIVRKLADRGAWSGRPLLRALARSVVHHRCAYMYASAGEYPRAVWRAVCGMVTYPLPYPAGTTPPLERSKRLARVVAGWLRRAGQVAD